MSRLPEDWRAARLGVPAPSDDEIAERAGQPEAMAAAARAAAGQSVSAMSAPSASLPAAFDLCDVGGRNYVTGVRDQAGCGSCVAFGTLASIESTASRSPVSEHGHSHMCLLATLATDRNLPVDYHEDAAGQIDQILV